MTVRVTGFGVRTAFGVGVDALRAGVFAGVQPFAPIDRFDTTPYRTPMAATGTERPSVRQAMADCAAEAVAMAGLPTDRPTAVLIGTGGDYTGITGFWRPGDSPDWCPPAESIPAVQAELLADKLGMTGPRIAFTNACVASATAIIQASRMIASGVIDAAVCAGGYLVEEEVFAKFDSGRAFSRDGVLRPFSADRSGMLLGDGAAAVVLESDRRRETPSLAEITGWAAASDAHHLAKPHPDGRGLTAALTAALTKAGPGASIDYVNAHGTATAANDSAETRGLRAALGAAAESTPISSTKSTTGHLLEAAGVVEFVITLVSLLDGVIPPTAGYSRADPACDLDYVTEGPRKADLRRVATINAAFGGANTAIVLERP